MSIAQNFRAKFKHFKLVYKALRKKPDSRIPTFLMYHSVSDDLKSEFIWPNVRVSVESFEQDLKYIAANYDVISIDNYIESIHNGTPLPRRSMIISFDDGYLDNLEYAIPMLKSYDMPAVLYLATKYLDTEEPQWIDSLNSIMKFRNKHRIIVDFVSNKCWNLQHQSEFNELFMIINKALITKTYSERNAILEHLAEQLEFENNMPRLTLNWNDVKAISQEFGSVTLGLHTDQHLDVSSHPLELKNEMALSIGKLKRATGVGARHFSFPYGRSFQDAHIILAEFGVHSAVCSTPEYEVNPENLRYHLPRIDTVSFSRRQWWYAD